MHPVFRLIPALALLVAAIAFGWPSLSSALGRTAAFLFMGGWDALFGVLLLTLVTGAQLLVLLAGGLLCLWTRVSADADDSALYSNSTYVIGFLLFFAACLLTGVAMWVLHPPAVRAPARFDAAFVSVGVYCAMAQAMMSATFLSRIVLRESLWAMR